uniref:Pirin n=1 Tax=Equus caballus TaxID=9796 RepID=A0A9L0RSL2_HORSE
MASSKKVTLSVLSREQSEGVGARVRRSIGRPELKNLDPFLLFDEFKGGRPGGFPDHPHRGFETVSYLLEGGSMAHEDFCGHVGQMNPGDLQWMTAGRGILHAEMPCSEEPAHGLQLWVNLRSSEKMVEPQYQELKSKEIPKPSKDGVTVAVISGEALGIKAFLRANLQKFLGREMKMANIFCGLMSPRFTLAHPPYIWTSNWTKEQSIPSLFLKGGQASFIPYLEMCILVSDEYVALGSIAVKFKLQKKRKGKMTPLMYLNTTPPPVRHQLFLHPSTYWYAQGRAPLRFQHVQ